MYATELNSNLLEEIISEAARKLKKIIIFNEKGKAISEITPCQCGKINASPLSPEMEAIFSSSGKTIKIMLCWKRNTRNERKYGYLSRLNYVINYENFTNRKF